MAAGLAEGETAVAAELRGGYMSVGRTETSMMEEDNGDDGGRKPEGWKGVLAEFHLHVLRSYAPIYIYISK